MISHNPHSPITLNRALLVLIFALLLFAALPAAFCSELGMVTVSGYVRTADGTGLEGVSVYGYYQYSYPSVTTTTDIQGYYQLEYPLGQGGWIFASKSLYTFEPESIHFDGLNADLTDANFTAIRCKIISGHIRTAGGTPVQYASVEMVSGGQLSVTDENGFYQAGVTSGWTGIIQVTKDYCTFNPPAKYYENVNTDLADQDIEAIPYNCISGYVNTAEGEPVEDVVVRTPDYWSFYEDNICYTDATGYYLLRVPPDWSGRMYAEKWTYLFEPTEKTYQNVNSDIPGQDYTAIPFKRISGYVRTADGTPVEGVSALSYNENGSGAGAITDAAGFYSVSVPPGWSGGVEVYTHNKPFSFDPAHRYYENVTEDIAGQDVLAIPFVQISGYVRTPDGTPIADASVYSNTYGRTYTDTNGFYSISLPTGDSGMIDVYKACYKMEPEYISYENVISELSNQNFTALPFLVIQGSVRTPDGRGLEDVYVGVSYDGFSGRTDENGDYTCLVPPGWSGSASAQKSLYTIEPEFKTYENVTSGLTGEDYIAIPYVTISGYVRSVDGQPLQAAVSASGTYGSKQTDSNGYYAIQVPPAWSGTIYVNVYQYALTPATRSYQNLTTDQTDQNYTGAPYKTISGHVSMADGSPVAGVNIVRDGGIWVADVSTDGFYSFGVPPGWSGTVKAGGSYLACEPASRSYSDVQADITDQDYTLIRLHKISGCIRGVNGERVDYSCVRASGVDKEFLVSSDGRYVIGVLPGWSGTITPEGWFFEMEPKSRSYTNVGSDISEQDYTATPVSKTLSDIKKSPDDTYVICQNVYITACFNDCIYVGTVNHDFGIKVCCQGGYYTPGRRLFLTGFVSKDSNGERCIIPSYMVDVTY